MSRGGPLDGWGPFSDWGPLDGIIPFGWRTIGIQISWAPPTESKGGGGVHLGACVRGWGVHY